MFSKGTSEVTSLHQAQSNPHKLNAENDIECELLISGRTGRTTSLQLPEDEAKEERRNTAGSRHRSQTLFLKIR